MNFLFSQLESLVAPHESKDQEIIFANAFRALLTFTVADSNDSDTSTWIEWKESLNLTVEKNEMAPEKSSIINDFNNLKLRVRFI